MCRYVQVWVRTLHGDVGCLCFDSVTAGLEPFILEQEVKLVVSFCGDGIQGSNALLIRWDFVFSHPPHKHGPFTQWP